MSDDSFIREVEEELRSDRLKSFWDRFGTFIIGAAVLLVVATAATRFYDYYTSSKANESGDRFLVALNLANDGKSEEALTALQDLEKDGFGQYPVLARMRAATVLANDGKVDEAVGMFDAVAADSSVPVAIRDIAKLRAGYALVDTAEYDEVAKRVEVLSSTENTLRHAAREAMGLAAWRAEKFADAQTFFSDIINDEQSPSGVAQRARIMLELITASGKVVEG
ncbi:tetratricopeptide repeat protein [Ahrensia sp. 13_GOM-1096m]|uniref:tetratricopeptide repeat protein n=1 Tax=Ahrensia sp. 13_GOM-1096m TaxID=1380380 RepID=UPI00047B83A8|nr:tetratricopeptide repeat protein [Ahrensia sp. 13_GOM-1096m]